MMCLLHQPALPETGYRMCARLISDTTGHILPYDGFGDQTLLLVLLIEVKKQPGKISCREIATHDGVNYLSTFSVLIVRKLLVVYVTIDKNNYNVL